MKESTRCETPTQNKRHKSIEQTLSFKNLYEDRKHEKYSHGVEVDTRSYSLLTHPEKIGATVQYQDPCKWIAIFSLSWWLLWGYPEVWASTYGDTTARLGVSWGSPVREQHVAPLQCQGRRTKQVNITKRVLVCSLKCHGTKSPFKQGVSTLFSYFGSPSPYITCHLP